MPKGSKVAVTRVRELAMTYSTLLDITYARRSSLSYLADVITSCLHAAKDVHQRRHEHVEGMRSYASPENILPALLVRHETVCALLILMHDRVVICKHLELQSRP